MKFGRPLTIIVHYTIQFNLSVAKALWPDIGHNTLLKIKRIIITRLKSDITKIQTYNPYEIW